MGHQSIRDLTTEEQALWKRVDQLWKCSMEGNFSTIEEAIHPKYTGWDSKSVVPHDRSYALQSMSDQSARLVEYQLFPLTITVYEHEVGIVNYRYTADIKDLIGNIRKTKGRWTEVFCKRNNVWILIGVHGESESMKMISAVNIY
ncbi:MAG: nuclear transport factor 2 family protein [Fodinibius sp.]|nr:nuclear transport factor 2 family protein [Fodinibius sp.]